MGIITSDSSLLQIQTCMKMLKPDTEPHQLAPAFKISSSFLNMAVKAWPDLALSAFLIIQRCPGHPDLLTVLKSPRLFPSQDLNLSVASAWNSFSPDSAWLTP